jgi:hypothetical protein
LLRLAEEEGEEELLLERVVEQVVEGYGGVEKEGRVA